MQVHGSGALVRWLFENHLVDELTLLTYPVVIGQSRVTAGGVIIQVYRPAGRPQYAT